METIEYLGARAVVLGSLSVFPAVNGLYAVVGLLVGEGFKTLGYVRAEQIERFKVYRGRINDFEWVNSEPCRDVIAGELGLTFK